jgi:hypothetical protein
MTELNPCLESTSKTVVFYTITNCDHDRNVGIEVLDSTLHLKSCRQYQRTVGQIGHSMVPSSTVVVCLAARDVRLGVMQL